MLPKPLTAQEIFDKVATHLLTQKSKSTNHVDTEGHGLSLKCAYRGQAGRTCAIGCLIPDEHYLPKMEGKIVDNLFNDSVLGNRLERCGLSYVNLPLLKMLQLVHDSSPVANWETSLRRVADNFRLNYGPAR